MLTTGRQRPPAATHTGQVALLGLPAACAVELAPALAAVGVHATVHADLSRLPAVLALPDLAALVAPQRASASLLAATGPWTSTPVRVVLELTSGQVEDCAAALDDGATGVFAPGGDVRDAATAVQLALRGQTVLPRPLAVALSALPAPRPPSVTAEERRWLRALAVGATVTLLAEGCARSEHDVYRRLAALYSRLGAGDRTEALLAAHRWGLLSDAAQD